LPFQLGDALLVGLFGADVHTVSANPTGHLSNQPHEGLQFWRELPCVLRGRVF
jgi:hypothetical protein